MKKILILILLNSFILNAQNINPEINRLEKNRKEFIEKINSLKDSISIIDKKINIIKSKEILKTVKDSSLNAIVSKNGKLRKGTNSWDDIIFSFEEDTEVLILDYHKGYFGVCINSVCGYVNEIWIKKNKKVVDLVYVRLQEEEELAKRKEENKIKKENKQYADIEAKNIKKYGKTLYAKLKKGMFWIGMTDDMAIISLGNPKDINRTVGKWGVHEQWVYDGDYYYFENGILTSYQD
ncbi:MAG: hypothetical protein H7Y10_10940 [Flavobacterium sp.]|nr:hypothetical protein [Flavobacterium sp.]